MNVFLLVRLTVNHMLAINFKMRISQNRHSVLSLSVEKQIDKELLKIPSTGSKVLPQHVCYFCYSKKMQIMF